MAVILTGMGNDGSLGAKHVAAVGGALVVQDPLSATATSMPRTAISLGLPMEVVSLPDIAKAVRRQVDKLVPNLARSRSPARPQ